MVLSESLTWYFQAKCLETGETMAIKKVLQDRRYKNRELQLMRLMDHPNVVSLKHCFFSTTSRDELFLNLVMEYVPETMYRVLKHYSSMNQRMPLIYVKLYTYQVWIFMCFSWVVWVICMSCYCILVVPCIICTSSPFHLYPDTKWNTFQIFRGLAYIHTVPGVCHRDVKPQNLLVCFPTLFFSFITWIVCLTYFMRTLQVDPLTHQVKLCDFGSAKVLVCFCCHSSLVCYLKFEIIITVFRIKSMENKYIIFNNFFFSVFYSHGEFIW